MSERYPNELANLRTTLKTYATEVRRNETRIRDHVTAARHLRARRADLRASITIIKQKIKEAEKPCTPKST